MKARRDKPKKIQPEYHLIVTEGTETEPAYFGAMKDIINRAYPDRIELNIHGAGDNTLNLFQKAKQMAASSANGYKHVSDDILSTVGSTNMDFRSFEHNFEVNAFMYDSASALALKSIFLQDQKDAILLQRKTWMKRPWYQKTQESIVRLLAPLL